MDSESTEPLVGRLGVGAHSEGMAYKLQGNEIAMCLPVGRMGSDKRGWSGTAEPEPERGPLG